MLTCETFREGKCRKEGISIFQHYFQHGLVNSGSDDATTDNDDVNLQQENKTKDESKEDTSSLSLEEELKQLRSKKPSASSQFAPYQTGSKGSVFLMCTAEGCQLIPTIRVDSDEGDKPEKGGTSKKQRTEGDDDSSSKDDTNDDKGTTKTTTKAEGTLAASDAAAESTPKDANAESDDKVGSNPWDPVPVVCKVFADAEANVTSAPSSRFITRMIPIQATCFASSAEIKATVEELLQKFFFPNKNYKSFAVSIQKRICNNVKKPEIIDMIAGRILDSDKKYKVSLDNPDATIVVEVVRTLCGIAVVPSTKTEMKHFNLLNARQKASPTEEE